VNKNYPSGYPTSIRMNCEFAAGSYPSLAPLCNESPNVEVTPEDNYLIDPWEHGKFRDADEFTILLNWSLDANAYGGAMLSMGNMEYGVDKKTLKPYVIIDGKTYSSENMLCTSDAWKTESTGTDGKSYMTKHGLFNTAIQYDKATRLLTIYRNGLIDQRFEVEGLMLDKITIGGFKGKLYNYRVYDSSVGISFLEMSLEEGQLEPISVSADVYTDIVLPSKTVNGKELAWRSDREDVISTSGLVTLPETETIVKLTTFIPHGKSYSTSKTWNVTVHPRDINNNLRYQHDETIDLTRNTATGFSTNKYEHAPEGLLDGLRSYTFLLSANAKRLTGQPRLYDFGSSSGNSVFLRANQLSAGIKYNGGTTTMVNGKTSLKANQDYQLAVTFDAATKKTCIYIDGKLDASGTNNQSEPYQLVENTSDSRNYIGRTQWWDSSVKADNQDFAGTIGGFRLYDIALTKEEINQIQSDITAVKGLNETNPVWKDGNVYDVCGRRMYADGLHNMKPGLYITQGQKIIVH